MGTFGWVVVGLVVVFAVAYFSMREPPRGKTARDYQKDGGTLHRGPPPSSSKTDDPI
ncbi:MAG: hypothetical protein JWM77_735 [Rhodospirillales bacterium]|jgi:hypothetical protein|nr:hypothetical protein [Rhodospirillales bacterium]